VHPVAGWDVALTRVLFGEIDLDEIVAERGLYASR
jgi:hypothetical protein